MILLINKLINSWQNKIWKKQSNIDKEAVPDKPGFQWFIHIHPLWWPKPKIKQLVGHFYEFIYTPTDETPLWENLWAKQGKLIWIIISVILCFDMWYHFFLDSIKPTSTTLGCPLLLFHIKKPKEEDLTQKRYIIINIEIHRKPYDWLLVGTSLRNAISYWRPNPNPNKTMDFIFRK